MASINTRMGNKILQLSHENFNYLLGAVRNMRGRQWKPEMKYWQVDECEENVLKLQEFLTSKQFDELLDNTINAQKNRKKKIKEHFPLLYPFQVEGVDQLCNGMTLVADHVGLGKTIEAIAFCEFSNFTKVLVVCPAPLKQQWRKEIEELFGKDAYLVEGDKKKRLGQIQNFQHGFLIMSYEIMREDILVLTEFFDIVIFDEVHRLKNQKSKTHHAAINLKSTRRIGLSATPFVNNPAELYTICKLLNRQFVNWTEFKQRFCELEYNSFAKMTLIKGYKNLDELHTEIKKMMIRRSKKDVFSQLPDRSYKNYIIGSPKEQKGLIDYYTMGASTTFNSTPDDIKNILANITLARMACDSTELIAMSESDLAIKPKVLVSSKIDALKEINEDIPDKMIIFTQWSRMAEILHKEFPNSILVTGDTADKNGAIAEFKSGKQKMLIATDCLNYGVNLQFCSIIVHFDMPWSPARIEQREGRIDRIGQENKMLIIKLVLGGTIEEKVLKLLETKDKMFMQTIDGSQNKEFLWELFKP